MAIVRTPDAVLADIRRNKLSISQDGLARRIGRKQCTISRLETRKQKFSAHHLRLLRGCLPRHLYRQILEAVSAQQKRLEESERKSAK